MLKGVDDMNDSWSCAHGFKFYEQLRVVDDMNESGSWAKGSECCEKLKVVINVNKLQVMSLGF